MGRVRVESEAWLDLLSIAEYLASVAKNPPAVRALIQEFEQKCESYARQPLMGDPGKTSDTVCAASPSAGDTSWSTDQ